MEESKKPFRIFAKQIFFIFTIFFFALLTGFKILDQAKSKIKNITQSSEISVWQFIIAFFVMTAIFLLLLKVLKGGRFFDILFTLALASGIFIVLSQFLGLWLSFISTLIIIIFNKIISSVLSHNLVLSLGLAGIAANLGLSVSVKTAILVLIILSFYDIFAVLKSKHMVRMFTGLVERGVMLSLIIPTKLKDFNQKIKSVRPGKDFMFLGSGDLAFPALLAVSALPENIISSIIISLGALVGIFVTQVIYSWQKEKRALPALPSIALFSILGYFISQIFI